MRSVTYTSNPISCLPRERGDHLNYIFKSDKNQNLFWDLNLKLVEDKNVRRNETDIELDYLGNFLGVQMSKDLFEKNKEVFIPLIQNRHGMIDLVSKDLHKRFLQQFPNISKFI